MKTNIPLLSNFEEEPRGHGPQTSVALLDEVTFVGKVYKSVLLDLGPLTGVNVLSKDTKVREETTDDE